MNENLRKIRFIPQERIFSSANQLRKLFDEESIHDLARSIEYCGLMQPIVVRRIDSHFEIIAGERRYRACLMAGIRKIPCLIAEADNERAEIMALSENMQRSDPDCFEVAWGIGRMKKKYRLEEEECARRLGKSRSVITKKLRLLQLDKKLIAVIRRDGLTESHAGALLQIGDERLRFKAEKHMAKEKMNGVQAESFAASLQEGAAVQHLEPTDRNRIYVIKDIRVFLNSVYKAVETMREGGIAATMEHGEENDNLILTIRIPKRSDERSIGR